MIRSQCQKRRGTELGSKRARSLSSIDKKLRLDRKRGDDMICAALFFFFLFAFFLAVMIRFPSDCRTMTSPSHSRKSLKFFFKNIYLGGSATRMVTHAASVALRRVSALWGAGMGTDDSSSMVAMRRFWPSPSPRPSVIKSCQSEGPESARILCCVRQQDVSVSSSPPAAPPPQSAPRG